MMSLILMVAGIAMAAQAISTANFMSRKAPLSIAVEVIGKFGFSVGTVISGYNHDTENALIFLIVAVVLKCILVVDLLCRGYAPTLSLLTCNFDSKRERRQFMTPARRSSDHQDSAETI